MSYVYATRLSLTAARRQLGDLQRRAFALRHAAGALDFDAATLAPPGNRAARARSVNALSRAELELVSSAEGIRLLDYLHEHSSELTPQERRSVQLLRRSGSILRHVQLEEYLSYRKLANETAAMWAAAHSRGDFSLLEPWLGRLFAAAKHIALSVEPDRPPFDFWLDWNEEGLTGEKCEALFNRLRGLVAPLCERALELPEPDTSMLGIRVSPLRQQRIAHANMDALGVDSMRCRLAVSERPFTAAFSKYDVRICTRYIPESFTTSLYGVMHECGHALYELNTDDGLQFTCLGTGASTGAHECSARFYENIIGRSMAWTEHMWPVLTENIPELGDYSPRELFRAVNAVHRTPLRTQADEAGYCLHIALRFEIERSLFDGGIGIHDAPALWNELTRRYLHCEARSDAEGILQDSHWCSGQFGYFPSYALGSAAAAQLLALMRRDIDVDGALRSGNTGSINEWMRDRLWHSGALYTPGELMESALGGEIDVKYYADYLAERMREVYEV